MSPDHVTTGLALDNAVEDLYSAFASYPLRDPVPGCSCCVHPEDQRQLAAAPLRELSAEELGRYSFKAMTTWGDVDDFKHFLPRILEILCKDRASGFDPFLLFGKLAFAKSEEWPKAERHAVDLFIRQLWRHILLTYPYHISAINFLQGISRIEDDFGPFLDLWIATDSSSATKHLVDLINGCQAWPLWVVQDGKAPERHAQQILELFQNATIEGRLEAEFFASEDKEEAWRISMAVELLESLSTAPEN